MRKNILLFAMLTLVVSVFAQAPDKVSYQAIVRDVNNTLVKNTVVGTQISILQGTSNGSAVYVEDHQVQTNINGLITLEIGAGNVVSGDFSSIDWSAGPYFIKVENDPMGGTSYTISGTSQLLSVPYALHANTADALSTPMDETDPVFDTSVAAGITAADTAYWNNMLPLAQSGNMITYDGSNWVAKDLAVACGNAGVNLPFDNRQPYLTLNYCIATVGIYPSRNSENPFIGEIELFGFNFAPRGYASCDGQLMAIAQNTALFSLLGTIYGGDGRTTFALPDLRGRVPIHYGHGPGLSDYRIGQKGGSETITLTTSNLPSHNHNIVVSYED